MEIKGKCVYADDNKFITQKECADNERMFCTEMRTGKFFNIENWTEWTVEEAKQWEEEHRPELEPSKDA